MYGFFDLILNCLSISYPFFTLDGPLPLYPSSTVLHYAQTVFEGMKAYRNELGQVTMFRPDMNMKRMNNSAQRIALPVCFHSSETNGATPLGKDMLRPKNVRTSVLQYARFEYLQ